MPPEAMKGSLHYSFVYVECLRSLQLFFLFLSASLYSTTSFLSLFSPNKERAVKFPEYNTHFTVTEACATVPHLPASASYVFTPVTPTPIVQIFAESRHSHFYYQHKNQQQIHKHNHKHSFTKVNVKEWVFFSFLLCKYYLSCLTITSIDRFLFQIKVPQCACSLESL